MARSVELRAGDPLSFENEGRKVYGYAAKFDSDSQDLGGFIERIAPGAFKQSLDSGSDVRCLVDHESRLVLGRRSSGTFRVSEDSTGLVMECDLPDTSYARDLAECLRRGDINQCSFGFTVPPDGDEWSRDQETGVRRRVLRSVMLVECSIVTFPAYESTEAALRSLHQTAKFQRADLRLLALRRFDLRPR